MSDPIIKNSEEHQTVENDKQKPILKSSPTTASSLLQTSKLHCLDDVAPFQSVTGQLHSINFNPFTMNSEIATSGISPSTNGSTQVTTLTNQGTPIMNPTAIYSFIPLPSLHTHPLGFIPTGISPYEMSSNSMSLPGSLSSEIPLLEGRYIANPNQDNAAVNSKNVLKKDESKSIKKRRLSSTICSEEQVFVSSFQPSEAFNTSQSKSFDTTQQQETSNTLNEDSSSMDKKEAQRQRNRLSAQHHRERQKKLMHDLKTELQEAKQVNQQLEWKVKKIESENAALVIENERLQGCVDDLKLEVKNLVDGLPTERELSDTVPASSSTSPIIAPRIPHTLQPNGLASRTGSPASPMSTPSDAVSNSSGVVVGVPAQSHMDSPVVSDSVSTTDTFSPRNDQRYGESPTSNDEERSPVVSYEEPWLLSSSERINSMMYSSGIMSTHEMNGFGSGLDGQNDYSIDDYRNTICSPHSDNNNVDYLSHCLSSVHDSLDLRPPQKDDMLLPFLTQQPPFENQHYYFDGEDRSGWNSEASCMVASSLPRMDTNYSSFRVDSTNVHNEFANNKLRSSDECWNSTVSPNLSPPLSRSSTPNAPSLTDDLFSTPRELRYRGGSPLSWSSPLPMLFFIVAILACVLYPTPETGSSISSLSAIGLLPSPVDAAPKGRELVVYASERSLVPIDYFDHHGGPSVTLYYGNEHIDDTGVHINSNHPDIIKPNGKENTFSSSFKQNDTYNMALSPFKLLCPKPAFIVGTSEDLNDYLSSFANEVQSPKLVLTVPSSAFESIQFPPSILKERVLRPESINYSNQEDRLSDAQKITQKKAMTADSVIINESDVKMINTKEKNLDETSLNNIEEITQPTRETDRLIWEANLKGSAEQILVKFGEKLIEKKSSMEGRNPVSINDVVSVQKPKRKFSCSDNVVTQKGQYALENGHNKNRVLEEMPVHIVCGDVQWDNIDLSLRKREKH